MRPSAPRPAPPRPRHPCRPRGSIEVSSYSGRDPAARRRRKGNVRGHASARVGMSRVVRAHVPDPDLPPDPEPEARVSRDRPVRDLRRGKRIRPARGHAPVDDRAELGYTVPGPVLPSSSRRRFPSTSRRFGRTISVLRHPVRRGRWMMSARPRPSACRSSAALGRRISSGDRNRVSLGRRFGSTEVAGLAMRVCRGTGE